jgi:hypothetical protein
VPELRLIPIDKQHRKVPWLFAFDGHSATLFSADQPVAYFLHEMANDRIILPSFWENITHLGVVANDGSKIWFAPEKQTVAKIKAYLNWALAIQGPGLINDLKKQAKANWYWGIGFLALGVFLETCGALQFLGIHKDHVIHHLAWFPALFEIIRAWRTRKLVRQIQNIQVSMGTEPS